MPGSRHLVGDVPVLETALPGAGYTRRVCMLRTQWQAAPLGSSRKPKSPLRHQSDKRGRWRIGPTADPNRIGDPNRIEPRNKRVILESLHPHRRRLPFKNSALNPLSGCRSIGKSLAICIVQPMSDQYRITNYGSNGPRRAGRKSQRRSDPCSA
jgi:hypothetical protein